jgi:hypothetical protein
MRTFAFAFAVPLVILLLVVIRLIVSSWRSSVTIGVVESVEKKDWLDDDAYRAMRYFPTFVFSVRNERYRITSKHPYTEPPTVGHRVRIRYKNMSPGNAMIESDNNKWWVLAPIAICLFAEVVIIRGYFQ